MRSLVQWSLILLLSMPWHPAAGQGGAGLDRPVDVALTVAAKVVRETSFDLVSVPQRFRDPVPVADLGRIAIAGSRGQLFARTVVRVDKDTVLRLGISHTGPLTLWVNGTRTYHAEHGTGAFKEYAYDMYRFPVCVTLALRTGDDTITVATADGDTSARAAVSFLTADDRIAACVAFTDASPTVPRATWSYRRQPDASARVRAEDPAAIQGDTLRWFAAVPRIVRNDVIPQEASFSGHSYIEWHYANGQMALAMIALADRTGSSDVLAWTRRYAETTLATLAEFRHQYEVLLEQRGFNYRLFRRAMLDDTSAPALPFVEYLLRGLYAEGRSLVDSAASYVRNGQSRLGDGTLCRPEPVPGTVWADDLFMAVPFLVRYARLTEDPAYADDAVRQVTSMYGRLIDPASGCAVHAWFEPERKRSVAAWGRANGWMIWGATEALLHLPQGHPRYSAILQLYRDHVRALMAHQSESGLWHQVIDHPGTFSETSASAMFVIAIARGIVHGWLDRSLVDVAWRAWAGIVTRVDVDGTVQGICQGTGVGSDVAFYARRKTPAHDPRGLGAVITAALEMQSLLERGLTPSTTKGGK